MTISSPASHAPQRSRRLRQFAGCFSLGYVLFLCALGIIRRSYDTTGQISGLQLEDLLQPFQWLVVLAFYGLVEIAKFLAAGVLVGLCLGRPTAGRSSVASVASRALAILTGIGLSIVVRWSETGRFPIVASFVLPLTGYLLGLWIGSTLLQGWRATLWLVPKVGLLLLALVAGATVLALLAMEDSPSPFVPPRVNSAEKRRLAEVIGSRHVTQEETRRLELAQQDVNLLIALGWSHVPLDGKAEVALDEAMIEGRLSLNTPFRGSALAYVNAEGTCRLEVSAGRLWVRRERLRVGRVRVPKIFLRLGASALVSAVHEDPDLSRVMASIDSVRITPGALETVYHSGVFSDGVVPSVLARLGDRPNASIQTRVHFRHLVAEAETLPEGDQRLAAFVHQAFTLAKKRSVDNDPVIENRAAVLALAILLGHERVESLVGPVTDGELRAAARRSVGKVTLRGRGDWTKHFFVCAGLALVSSGTISDGVGLFKEELDAGGGSGFSFSDLLADRAGTLFAMAATRDKTSARQMQERLSREFPIDEIFPPAADLPEGISDANLNTDYGGVDGKKYMQVVEEIERRLKGCTALHPG